MCPEEEGEYFGSMQDEYYAPRLLDGEDEEDIDKHGGNNLDDMHGRHMDSEDAEDVQGACPEVNHILCFRHQLPRLQDAFSFFAVDK